MAQAIHAERRNGAARAALKARASDVLDDFAELRKDVNRLADAAGKAARAEAKHASKRLNSISGTVRERATATVTDIRDRAAESAEYAADKVRTHPGAAVGISLGAGLLIGLLLSRR
ncbi:MAG: hypothetical protein K2P70_13125 [Hyphomonadaceae bacterium]|nr:hypothetical protein [Hyphomonadaceae bacterium]